VQPDGTHIYASYHRYRPLTPAERTYGVRKPDDPRAVRFYGEWFLPLEFLPMKAREMPETRPDDQTLEHRAVCTCKVCRRPEARVLWRRERNRLR
jgi:hypothetical protein